MELEQEITGAFFEQMSCAAYVKDENLKFVYVNSAYAEFFGMDPKRFIGKRAFQITNTVATKLLEQDEAKVLASGVATLGNDRATSYRGETVWREVERRPITTGSGTRYLTVTLLDISKYKDIEYKLQDKEEELAKTLNLVEISERRNADFVTKIAHQVKIPLESIMSIANSFAQKAFDKDPNTFSDQIISSGRAALNILDDVSNHSSLDIMKVPVKSEPFELFELVFDIIAVATPEARKKELKFSTYIDPEIPMQLTGDPSKIRQVLVNLINNAIKFTDKGEISVNVNIVSDDIGQLTKIRFEVCDTGLGISQQEQEHLFETYNSFSKSRKEGMGLSISSALVALMDGEIGVNRRPEGGSKFWFEIGFDTPKKIVLPIQQNPDLKKKRFIIVDNNEFDRALIENQLQEWGGDAAACCNSDEAIAVMCALFEKNLTVDGIFIDDETNQANDIDLHALMRDDDVLSQIPLFVMVPSADNLKVRASLANDHIVKPLDIGSFKTIIEHAYSEELSDQSIVEDVVDLSDLSINDGMQNNIEGLQTLIGNDRDMSKIDILILESNTVNQIVFAQILETTGYKFKIAANFSEADALFKSCYPKVILVDSTNREFNNEQTRLGLEKFKRFDSRIPLLGMTAAKNSGDREDLSLLYRIFDDHIKKPVSPPELFNLIEKWMRTIEDEQIQIA